MPIRIHHKEMAYIGNFVRSGLSQLIEKGITPEFLIDSFPAQLNRLRLEIDMEGLTSLVADPGEHPLKIAAEYMMAEMLLPPFMPSKHGIPVHVPIEYAAKACMNEWDDFHPGYLDDPYSICSLIATSDEYAYAAYMMGFPHDVRIIEHATPDQIKNLAEANGHGLYFIMQDLISKELWMEVGIRQPHYLKSMPAECINKEYLSKIFAKNHMAIRDLEFNSDETILASLLNYGFSSEECFEIFLDQHGIRAEHVTGFNENQIIELMDMQKGDGVHSNHLPLLHRTLNYKDQPLSIVLKGLEIVEILGESQSHFISGLNVDQVKELFEMKSIDMDCIPNSMRPHLGYPLRNEDYDDHIPF